MTIYVDASKMHWNYYLALEHDMEVVSRYVDGLRCQESWTCTSLRLSRLQANLPVSSTPVSVWPALPHRLRVSLRPLWVLDSTGRRNKLAESLSRHPPLHPISRVVTVTWRQHIDFERFCQRNTFAAIRDTPLEGLRLAFAIHRITLPHWFVPFLPTLREPGNLAIGNCLSNNQLLAKPFIDGGQVLKFYEEL